MMSGMALSRGSGISVEIRVWVEDWVKVEE